MILSKTTLNNRRKPINREEFFTILNAALQAHSFSFARQAALYWLKTYTGDLEVKLTLAQVLFGEGKRHQAIEEVEHLCQIDPAFAGGWQTLAWMTRQMDYERYITALANLKALGQEFHTGMSLPPWGEDLWEVEQAISGEKFEVAEETLYRILSQNPDFPLPAVVHLKLNLITQDAVTVKNLAEIYHERWPECLQFLLGLAEARIEMGDETGAVSLLHECVAQDVTGQVPRRLWGDDFRYRPLWPETFAILFDLPVPADVASVLGWNTLPQGKIVTVEAPALEAEETALEPEANEPEAVEEAGNEQLTEAAEPGDEGGGLLEALFAAARMEAPVDEEQKPETGDTAEPEPAAAEPLEEEIPETAEPAPEEKPETAEKVITPEERKQTRVSVEKAFEKLAKKLKQPSLAQADNRFPMYVIFSSQVGLERKYGRQTRSIINKEMNLLAEEVRKRPEWGAVVFCPDDVEFTNGLSVSAMDVVDPWKLKLSLVDLDQSLAKKGAMIGALLIVGGPDVVPFHKLPNPTDDMDQEVCSDNPYGTLDGNYFVTEWPVGRLPGEGGKDAGLLLEQLRNVIRHHQQGNLKKEGWNPYLTPVYWWKFIFDLLKNWFTFGKLPNFGYTASVWRRSSLAVYRPVGDGHSLLVSPPEISGSFDGKKAVESVLGYYNLHGLVDSADWYGQRDVSEPYPGPDYPVALSPKDLHKNGKAPRIVFSEACYGGHIFNKTEDDSLTLKFISLGTLGVVSSTCIAYGSVNTPLIGADLLGYLFWRYIRDGVPAGEALMKARISMVQQMERIQGFLDGEDQKTLISFVLYGDPLATYEDGAYTSQQKGFRLARKLEVNAVSDRQDSDQCIPKRLSSEMLIEVKEIVEPYLPGLDSAEIFVSEFAGETGADSGNELVESLGEKSRKGERKGRVLVTVSKQVQVAQHVHQHYARVTFDEDGKMVKMAISR